MLSPVHGRQQQSEKSIPQFTYQLRAGLMQNGMFPKIRADVIAVYGEDIYAEIVAEQCSLTLTKPDDDWLSKFRRNLPKKNLYAKLKNFVHEENIFIKCSDFKSFKAGFLIKSPTSKVLIHGSENKVPSRSRRNGNWK
jgi:hypothetical protein